MESAALKPTNPQAHNLIIPQTVQPTSPQAQKLKSPHTHKPSNPQALKLKSPKVPKLCIIGYTNLKLLTPSLP